jgi:glucoamylase
VFNWTRDAAAVAIELAAGPLPSSQPVIDYVQFAQTCQTSASAIGHFDRASFCVNGTPRDWSDQTDGPALQTLAIPQMYAQLDAPTQAVANAVIAENLKFLQNAYQGATFNLWEEEQGASFFARSVQLKCFEVVSANTFGIPVLRGSPARFRGSRTPWPGPVSTTMLNGMIRRVRATWRAGRRGGPPRRRDANAASP